jgi:hypothetical protein
MRELNTTIVATRILMSEWHPIRHFFTNRRIQDEYAMKKGTPSSIFMKTIDKFGEWTQGKWTQRPVTTGPQNSPCVPSPKEPAENKL